MGSSLTRYRTQKAEAVEGINELPSAYSKPCRAIPKPVM